MFKRPHTSKTSTPLRNSALRALRAELGSYFSVPAEAATLLLPDGTLSYKGKTHLDEPITIYAAPNGDPRFWKVGKKEDGDLIPTCYAFDCREGLLPTLETAQAVVDHLISGAALFAQGVSDRSIAALPKDIKLGALVSITAQGSDKVVAVGYLNQSKAELAKHADKAVITLHARGDHLWLSGSQEEHTPVAGSASSSTAPPPPAPAAADPSPDALADDLASTSLAPPPSEPAPSASLSPADVDSILRNALLLAISQTLAKSSNLFPMSASTLYSSYILPYRPAGTPPSADIKQSSFKKLDKFLKLCDQAGVIKTKSQKSEVVVVSVNATHPDVQTVRGYKTLAQAAKQETKAAAAADAATSAPPATSTVRELYKATSASLPLFQAATFPRPEDDLYTHGELKAMLLQYAKDNNLVHPRDQRHLVLDEVLAGVVLKKGEALELMSKDQALERLKGACAEWWEHQRDGEVILKKGHPPIIHVHLKPVGKRTVTLISQHEGWDLSSEQLAEELKKLSASSTAVQPLTGTTKKGVKPRDEVMVQGSFDGLVIKVLAGKGVPSKYVEVGKGKK